MIYLLLFWSFFKVGCFSFGGGYAALPLIQQQIVDGNMWMTAKNFADVIALAEITPGPIFINAATFVGMKQAGFAGAVAATLGSITPSCLISLLLAVLYIKFGNLRAVKTVLDYMKPAVIAAIAVFLASLMKVVLVKYGAGAARINYAAVLLTACLLAAGRKYRLSPIQTILAAAVFGFII